VIARNSTFTYKGKTIDVKEVGRELGVRYVLEGSVRKSGNRVRITAQLIGAMVGNQVWAQRYDRELTDIFAVQDEITERVVAAIEPQLYAAEHYRSVRKPPESLDAWECVARALSYVGQGTFAGHQEAEALCRRAIAITPGYSQAHSLLAWVLLRRTIWSGNLKSVLPEVTAETRTAIGLDEHDPWSHMVQGAVLHRMRRFEEAVLALHQALELNPNFALAHAYLAAALAIQGTHEEAVKSAEHALRLSPNDRLIGGLALNAVAVSHFAARRYAACVASARKAIERNRDYPVVYAFLAAAAALEGNMSAAEEALNNLLILQPHFSLFSVRENGALVGEMADRTIEGLRRAGAPET
jgi:tetratricopeptide (TPR) repeat protein